MILCKMSQILTEIAESLKFILNSSYATKHSCSLNVLTLNSYLRLIKKLEDISDKLDDKSSTDDNISDINETITNSIGESINQASGTHFFDKYLLVKDSVIYLLTSLILYWKTRTPLPIPLKLSF